MLRLPLFSACLLVASLAPASAKTLCTVVADASDMRVLVQEGDCETRVTPASTFKVALAVIGFDSGFLEDAHGPTFTYRDGEPDWGGAAWKEPTDPQRWMKYSVVWYSQRIAHALGAARLTDYARRLDYGNADFSGDAGKDNGLDRAWIGSSLKLSPVEQIAFLGKLVNRRLPVSETVYGKVEQIVESFPAGPWRVYGKTGMAYPRRADDSFDKAHAFGWFVGWATQRGRTLVFARLIQDERVETGPAGHRARAAFLAELPGLAAPTR